MSNYVSRMAQNAWDAVSFQAKKAVDETVKQKIDEVSSQASQAVADKLFNFLYQDPERYGLVQGTKQRVDIYYKNSQVLNNVMRMATGFTIDEYIKELPPGLKQLAGTIRTSLESMVAKIILEQLTDLSVKRLTTHALLKSYGYTEEQILNFIKNNVTGTGTPEIKAILKENELKQKASISPDLKALADQKTEDGISLLDVYKYYKYSIEQNLNNYVRASMVEAVAEASGTLSAQAIENGLKKVEQTAAGAGMALLPFGLVTPAIAGLGIGYGINQIKDPLKAAASEKASHIARCATEHYLPTDLFSINHEDGGKVTFTEINDVDDEAFGFYNMSVLTPTFNRWVKTKLSGILQELRNLCSSKSQGNSNIPVVTANWFVDNDFSKLNNMREAFVTAEKEYRNLDYTLMNICEFASGIRNDVDGQPYDFFNVEQRKEGLKKCQETLEAMSMRIAEIQGKTKAAVNHPSNKVDNAKRRDDLVNKSNTVLDEMVKKLKTYTYKVEEAIKEAQIETAKEEAAAKVERKVSLKAS